MIGADLQRSGLFRLVDPGGVVPVPTEPTEVNFPQWSARGAEALVIGTVTPMADGRFEVRFRLMDVVKSTQLAGFVYTVSAAQLG